LDDELQLEEIGMHVAKEAYIYSKETCVHSNETYAYPKNENGSDLHLEEEFMHFSKETYMHSKET